MSFPFSNVDLLNGMEIYNNSEKKWFELKVIYVDISRGKATMDILNMRNNEAWATTTMDNTSWTPSTFYTFNVILYLVLTV